ncbi:MAG: hypothetical protein COA53_05545 [Rhodobacteraceae bacterium]|nr:MAG: hypothetical protein COA53_05545 [Paracoccaceae bacterium]
MVDVKLKCKCGAVQGVASGVSAKSGTRLICCCKDCQEFARHLGFDGAILDENRGTDIFQASPKQIRFTQGIEHVRCLRLKPHGIYRWYAECCNTPIGNTGKAKIPFVGVIHNIMDDQGQRDQNLGPVLGVLAADSAIGQLPHNNSYISGKRLMMRVVTKVLLAKVAGHTKYTPFFDQNGKPIVEPTIVNKAD